MESINLMDVYKKLKEIEKNMATKEELAHAMETVCIMSNADTMNQIYESEENIKKGKCKQITCVEDL